MSIRILPFIFIAVFIGCQTTTEPVPPKPDTTEAEAAIVSAFGVVERNENGEIVAVDLAHGRASATDEVLDKALTIPGLKRFRLAGDVAAQTFSKLSTQTELEEFFVRDVPVADDELVSVLASLPKLKRLTLRRLSNATDKTIMSLPDRLTQLALIDMNVTSSGLHVLARKQTLRAVDLRNCGRLTASDYDELKRLPKLSDLKIGGFAVNDAVLETIVTLDGLTALTIDDSLISPDAWKTFSSVFRSRDKLETLALNRCPALFDDALKTLKEFPKLKRLTLGGMMITGSFLDALAEDELKRPKLHRLDLRKSLLTVDGANALKKYPELRYLDLSGTALTPDLAEVLGTLAFLETIDITDSQPDTETLEHLRQIKTIKGSE